MDSSDALLDDAFNLFEHVGIFFINPVSQVSTVIQDLAEKTKQKNKNKRTEKKPKSLFQISLRAWKVKDRKHWEKVLEFSIYLSAFFSN